MPTGCGAADMAIMFSYELIGQEHVELTAYLKGLLFLQLLSLEKSMLCGTPTDNPVQAVR